MLLKDEQEDLSSSTGCYPSRGAQDCAGLRLVGVPDQAAWRPAARIFGEDLRGGARTHVAGVAQGQPHAVRPRSGTTAPGVRLDVRGRIES